MIDRGHNCIDTGILRYSVFFLVNTMHFCTLENGQQNPKDFNMSFAVNSTKHAKTVVWPFKLYPVLFELFLFKCKHSNTNKNCNFFLNVRNFKSLTSELIPELHVYLYSAQ